MTIAMRSLRLAPLAATAMLGTALFLSCLAGCKPRKQTGGDSPTPSVASVASVSTSAVSNAGSASAAPATSDSASARDAPRAVEDDAGPWFVSSDGHYRVRAPGWQSAKSHEERNVLRIVRGTAWSLNLYEEKKVDYTAQNIDAFMAHELGLKKKDKQVPKDSIATLTIGGRPARQVEVAVTTDERRWVELFTVIEFADEYVEVSVVVQASKYERTAVTPVIQSVEPVTK